MAIVKTEKNSMLMKIRDETRDNETAWLKTFVSGMAKKTKKNVNVMLNENN